MMDATAIRTMVRAHDPITSIEAAERASAFAGTHRERIMRALRRPGYTLSSKEIAELAGLTVVQVDRRLTEIQRAGQAMVVVVDGNEVTRDGYRVWVATPE